MSVHGGGAAPPVPPLPLTALTPPDAAGAPADAGAPPEPATVVGGAPDAPTVAPAVPRTTGAPAVDVAPPAPSATLPLSQELRGRTKSTPVTARLKTWRGLGTSI